MVETAHGWNTWKAELKSSFCASGWHNKATRSLCAMLRHLSIFAKGSNRMTDSYPKLGQEGADRLSYPRLHWLCWPGYKVEVGFFIFVLGQLPAGIDEWCKDWALGRSAGTAATSMEARRETLIFHPNPSRHQHQGGQGIGMSSKPHFFIKMHADSLTNVQTK